MKKIEGIDKVYLGGPMSGQLDYNFHTFNAMARHLRDAGYVVINPAETAGGASHLERSWYFRFDFAVIACVDAVFVIEGWQASAGAKAEVVYANELGLPIYELAADNVSVYAHKVQITGVDVHVNRHR